MNNNDHMAFLDRGLDEGLSEDRLLDVIFSHVDDMLIAGDFDEVDKILWSLLQPYVYVRPLSVTTLLGFLCVTSAARGMLRERAGFFNRVKEHYMTCIPDRAERLLKGLE